MCMICHSPMLLTECTIALMCGHVYHDECVTQYAEVKGWTKDQACPLRCRSTLVHEIEAGEAERGQGEQEVIDDLENLMEQSLMDADAM